MFVGMKKRMDSPEAIEETRERRYPSLCFDRPLSWKEVFEIWRKNEESTGEWEEHWKRRGFSDWESWRSDYAFPLEPEEREWKLFTIGEPFRDVPKFLGAPSVAWIANVYRDSGTLPLADIVTLPQFSKVNQEKVSALRAQFPSETILTGIVWCENVIIIEGMHRACALSLGCSDSQSVYRKGVSIALSQWPYRSLPLLGGKSLSNRGDALRFEGKEFGAIL